MGIRFACPDCRYGLNVKTDLAGKRGVCPSCGSKFRIPRHDQPYADPLAANDSGTATSGSDDDAAHSLVHAAAPPPSGNLPGSESANVTERSVAAVGSSGAPSSAPSPAPIPPVAPPEPVTARFDILTENPAANWYVRPVSGGQYGPAGAEIMRQWLGENRVGPSALVWRDGWPMWRTAVEVFPQLQANETASSATNAPGLPTPAPGLSTSGDVVATRRRRMTKNRLMMVVGLSLVCLSLVAVLVGVLVYRG